MATNNINDIRALSIALNNLQVEAKTELKELEINSQEIYQSAHTHFIEFREYIDGLLNSFFDIVNHNDYSKMNHIIQRISQPARVIHDGNNLYFSSQFQEEGYRRYPNLAAYFTLLEMIRNKLLDFIKETN